MPRNPIIALFASFSVLAAGAALAQNSTAPKPAAAAVAANSAATFAAPGTKGSPIDGTVFHAQVLLDVAGFPAGVIDGKKGMSFKKAVQGFQTSRGLPTSGELDGATRSALLSLNRPSTVMVKLTPEMVGGPFVYPLPKKPELQSKLPALSYRNMIEQLAEAFHTTPETLIALNGPDAGIGVGASLRLPNIIPASRDYVGDLKPEYKAVMAGLNVDGAPAQGTSIIVDKSEGVLKVMGEGDKLVAQFPVTMGSTHDPLPVGDWKVTTYAFMPPFHYQPDLFWDAKDKTADDKMLPAGPNGPVGVAWLDLTKEHYGIHGTPSPETIGRAESHGCIRMTNWDVLRLSRMLKPGFKAVFQA